MPTRILLLLVLLLTLSCNGNGCDEGPLQPPPCPAPEPPGDDDDDKALPVTQASQFGTVYTEATGLGPLFNATSCASCHPGGQPVSPFQFQFFVTDGMCGPAPGGPIFQEHATPLFVAATGVEREEVQIGAEQVYRRPPDLFGMAFINDVPDSWILSNADPTDANGDGISGIVHVLGDGRIGRFGVRALVPTLREMVALAFREELGITSTGLGERGLYDQPLPPDTDPTPEPEISDADIDATVAEIRAFALPAKDEIGEGGGGGGGGGSSLFTTIGCAKCHMGPVYSDLLLHNLGGGAEVSDPCFLTAPANEIRTAPLLGLRFVQQGFMHAGETSSLQDAINAHRGEATAARLAYFTLPLGERQAVIAFLQGL